MNLVRKSLISLINGCHEYEILGSAENLTNALLDLDRLKERTDLVLCDYNLRNETAIDFLKVAHQRDYPPAILLTSFFNASQIHTSISHGARAFIFKEIDIDQLTQTFECVLAGGTCYQLPDASFASPLSNNKGQANHSHDILSAAENEILKWLTTGSSNKEIASVLKKSDETVKRQVASLLKKLNVKSRTEAVVKAISLNLMVD